MKFKLKRTYCRRLHVGKILNRRIDVGTLYKGILHVGYCKVQVSQYPTSLDRKQLEVREWSNDHWMFSSASLENIRNEQVLLEKPFTGNLTYSLGISTNVSSQAWEV